MHVAGEVWSGVPLNGRRWWSWWISGWGAKGHVTQINLHKNLDCVVFVLYAMASSKAVVAMVGRLGRPLLRTAGVRRSSVVGARGLSTTPHTLSTVDLREEAIFTAEHWEMRQVSPTYRG